MDLSPQAWHQRFELQARWTQSLRSYLYDRTGLARAEKVLEAGCGTGALLPELISVTTMHHPARVYGIDVDRLFLSQASEHAPQARLAQADVLALPFATGSFDASLCHFFLLWVNDPLKAIEEMRRVTRPGGPVLALAEPDYGGRIDYPQPLSQLGDWQQASLRAQGAEPQIGRRLAALFHGAGLQSVETGVLGGQWSRPASSEEWKSEWEMIEWDMEKSPDPVTLPGDFREKLDDLRALDQRARESGERVLFVPTFYAWGRVPTRMSA